MATIVCEKPIPKPLATDTCEQVLAVAAAILNVPLLRWTARTHRVVRHPRSLRGLVTGALVIAGLFTFPFDRMPGRWPSG